LYNSLHNMWMAPCFFVFCV